MLNEWNGFNDGVWTKEINVRNFIQKNYTLYEGDDSFLANVSQKTKKVWNKCEELLAEELKKVLSIYMAVNVWRTSHWNNMVIN